MIFIIDSYQFTNGKGESCKVKIKLSIINVWYVLKQK